MVKAFPFDHKSFFFFFFKREGERGEWVGEGERLLNRLHAQRGAQHRARSHNPEIMTWAEIKSRCLTSWATRRPDHESFDAGVILAYMSSYPIYNVLDFVRSSPSFIPFNVCDFFNVKSILNFLFLDLLPKSCIPC